MSNIIQDFIAQESFKTIPSAANVIENPLILGLIIGKPCLELIETYYAISQNPLIDGNIRYTILYQILKLNITPAWFERVAYALNSIPVLTIKSEVNKVLLEVFYKLSGAYKYHQDFLWLIRASSYMKQLISSDPVILFIDYVSDSIDYEVLPELLNIFCDIIQAYNLTAAYNVVSWVGERFLEFISKNNDPKALKNISYQFKILVFAVDASQKASFTEKYLQACNKFKLDIDQDFFELSGLNSLVRKDQSYENMNKITTDVINNINRDLRESKIVNIKKIGETFKEISSQSQDSMYKILFKLWSSQKTNFYMLKQWKLILKALKFSKVLKIQHYTELQKDVYNMDLQWSNP
jgi:hypothetical protein